MARAEVPTAISSSMGCKSSSEVMKELMMRQGDDLQQQGVDL